MTKKKFKNPPRFAEWILSCVYPDREDFTSVGDFREEFFEVHQSSGPFKANLWYWMQIAKSVPSYIRNQIHWRIVMIHNYLIIAFRNMKRHKGFSFINIFGLAIGMAAFIIIGLNIQYELSCDTHFKNADRIYRVASEVWQGNKVHYHHVGTPGPLAETLVDEYPEVESAVKIFKWTRGEVNLVSEKTSIFENLFYASPGVFDFFGINFVKGDPEVSMRDPFSIVLSEKIAEKYFGKESPVGKTFTYRERHCFTITGIFEDMPDNTHFKMDLITPFSTIGQNVNWINHWNIEGSHCYLMLRKDADPIELEKKFPGLLEKHRFGESAVEEDYRHRLYLQPLTSIHLHSNIRGEFRDNYDIKYVYLFSSLGLIILIMAFINYMNISITQSFRRSKEVGMRKVVGARRGQLIQQFLGESIIITFMALIISIVIAVGVLPVINNMLGRQLNFSLIENPQLPQYIAGAFIFMLITGILAGSYPAFLISSTKEVNILKGVYSGKIRGNILRNILVSVQFAITIFALIGTITIRNQLNYINEKDIGYNKDQILVLDVKIHNNVLSKINTLKTEFLKNPNILAVSSSSNLPNNIHSRGSSEFPQKDTTTPFEFCVNAVDYDFVDVYGIEIVEGRNFSRDFSSDEQGAVLINEEAAKNCAWESPLGKEFRFWGGSSGKIVGIMKDFHMRSLHYPIVPTFFVLVPDYTEYISIKIRTGNIPETISYIRNTLSAVLPNVLLDYYFFDEAFNRDYKEDQEMGSIFNGFAILTIIIACLGLFGLVAFSVQQRTKELGIRKVLGAKVSNVSALLTKELVRWTLLSNSIAWPAAYFVMNKWLQSFAYRIDLNVWIFTLSGLAALVIALLTISYQIIKAATANPVDSLRYE